MAATKVAISFHPQLDRKLPLLGQEKAFEIHKYNDQTMSASTTIHRSSNTEAPALPVSAMKFNGPGQAPHIHSSSDSTISLLLSLPGELRTAIYIAALEHSQGFRLLYTCRQIYMEALPVLYQRPLHFASQTKLFSWLERGKAQDFIRVRSLTLRLTDVDLAPIFDATPSARGNNITAWDLYQRELVSLDNALCSLQGLEQLVILPPDKQKSTFVRSMYTCFLGRIVIRCPKLKQLMLHDNKSVLNKVPELGKLAKVVFDEPSSLTSTIRSCSESKVSPKMKEEMAVKMEVSDEGC